MELWVVQILPVRSGQSSCGLLALPQEGLPRKAQVSVNGSLGGNNCVIAAVCVCVCVRVCVRVC